MDEGQVTLRPQVCVVLGQGPQVQEEVGNVGLGQSFGDLLGLFGQEAQAGDLPNRVGVFVQDADGLEVVEKGAEVVEIGPDAGVVASGAIQPIKNVPRLKWPFLVTVVAVE